MGRPQVASDRKVLNEVGKIVSRAGIGGVTFAAVAERVGVTPSAVAQRFGSRRGLLLAFANLAAAEVGGVARQQNAKTSSPVAALLDVITAQVRGIKTPGQLANHLSFLELDLFDREFQDLAATHARALRSGLTDLVRDATAAGELAPCDAEAVAKLVQIVYNGALITWAVEPTEPLTDFVRSSVESVLPRRMPSGVGLAPPRMKAHQR